MAIVVLAAFTFACSEYVFQSYRLAYKLGQLSDQVREMRK